ncbi:1-deoxy-D-xylulose 5-phosphate reductoisomerase [Spirochaetia bacterium]|nr:1-deoxy-D-xylulose 5-phosphate reductoisomerase [Spirochaetia bacterium]
MKKPNPFPLRRIAVLGATGSIGQSTLDVLRQNRLAGRDDFEVVLLSSYTDQEGLLRLGEEFPGAVLVLAKKGGLIEAIAEAKPDITVNGIAGAAGLEPSAAAIRAGSDLALANKETIVMAGPLIFSMATEKKVRIIPVDSEHSAIFNLLNAHGRDNAEEILLTASGGPFRKLSLKELGAVTTKDALAHPTWKMGPKITIDSASMANKGLEVIEAVRLFDMPPEKIKVVVHPQSVVHSMVRMKDGAVYAQLSRPDMRLPIHEALFWPETAPSPFGALNFDALTLEFEKPDEEKFPMLPLAYEAARLGGLYPCVYNGANEAAVEAFFAEKAGFLDISRIVEYVLSKRWNTDTLDMGSILEADRMARDLAKEFIENNRGK